RGTADDLKRRSGGERLEITVGEPATMRAAVEVLRSVGSGEPAIDERAHQISVPVTGGSRVLIEALRLLDAAGVEVLDVGLRRPTLDDVFLALTGHEADNGESGGGDAAVLEGASA